MTNKIDNKLRKTVRNIVDGDCQGQRRKNCCKFSTGYLDDLLKHFFVQVKLLKPVHPVGIVTFRGHS